MVMMESFERIAARPENTEVRFGREIRCKIYSLDNERTLVMTEMHDSHHKIKLAFTTKWCAHLYEMPESAFRAFAASQKKSAAVKGSLYIIKRTPSLVGTCISFNRS